MSKLLATRGISVIDLDQLGRELSEQSPEVAREIARICGAEVLQADGQLDRTRVRTIIFSSPELRKQLERYLHPLIWKEFERRALEAEKAGARIVVCEAALLMETGLQVQLDETIVVTAPEDERSRRVMTRDRITMALAEKMIRSQMRDLERTETRIAVVENHGSLADLAIQVDDLVERWRSMGRLPPS